MSVPPLSDFLNALAVIEQFLLAKLAELQEKFPTEADNLQNLAEYLKAKGRTLEVLTLVAAELEVLESGRGPVSHDPVDLA